MNVHHSNAQRRHDAKECGKVVRFNWRRARDAAYVPYELTVSCCYGCDGWTVRVGIDDKPPGGRSLYFERSYGAVENSGARPRGEFARQTTGRERRLCLCAQRAGITVGSAAAAENAVGLNGPVLRRRRAIVSLARGSVVHLGPERHVRYQERIRCRRWQLKSLEPIRRLASGNVGSVGRRVCRPHTADGELQECSTTLAGVN